MFKTACLMGFIWLAYDLLCDKFVADYIGAYDLHLWQQIADAVQKASGH